MIEIATVKDFVLTITAPIAAYVALSGLSTWKKQLVGSTQHELVSEALTKVITLRNAVRWVRDGGVSHFELFEFGSTDRKINNPDLELGDVYRLRWQEVEKAATELETIHPKIEAIFSGELGQEIQKLLTKIETLKSQIHHYFCAVDKPQYWSELPDNTKTYAFKCFRAGKEDEYGRAFEENCENIRRIVREFYA